MAEKEYIEREAVLKELGLQRPDAFKNFASKVACLVIEIIIDVVKAIPSADVEPVRHGHWEQVDDTKCKCSECEVITMIAQYPIGADKNYCPNCGAKMSGDTT